MSIRLNKAIRELNIGLQTAVEFLEKRPELGEVKGDQNFKLSDEQFKALEKEFKPDQVVKNDAAKIFQKKQKDKVRTKKAFEPKKETVTKQELPKTSSETNTATAVGLGIVGLGAAMSLRRRKQHR